MVTAVSYCKPIDGLWHRVLLSHDAALINPQQVEAELWDDLPCMPLVPPLLQAHAKLMPRLLDLNAMTSEARVQLLERSEQHRRHSDQPFFSALVTFQKNRNFKKQAHHLTSRLILTGPNSGRCLLRYYDPRVFRHLLWIFNDNQLDRLLCGVKEWLWLDGNGIWQIFSPNAKTTAALIHVTPQQWDAIGRVGLLNRCLNWLAVGSGFDIAGLEQAKQVDQLLLEAQQQHGLADANDCCLFAEQAMVFGRELHRHPIMAGYLKRVKEGDVGYQTACQSLRDEQLQQFVAEIRQPTYSVHSRPLKGTLS